MPRRVVMSPAEAAARMLVTQFVSGMKGIGEKALASMSDSVLEDIGDALIEVHSRIERRRRRLAKKARPKVPNVEDP